VSIRVQGNKACAFSTDRKNPLDPECRPLHSESESIHIFGIREDKPVMMLTCPVCGSAEGSTVVEAEPRQARCSRCEATWEQRGSRTRNVQAGKLRGARPRAKRGALDVFRIRD
jgi:hypothetical protein